MAYYKYIRTCQKCNREYKIKEIKSSKYCLSCRKDLGLVKNTAKYSGNFYRNRKIIFERDNYRCQNCKGKENLLVHHIDVNKRNNSFSNLITLCTKCHLGLHRSYTKIELRRGNIYILFSELEKKRIKNKLIFLEKLSMKNNKSIKRFFNIKSNGKSNK